MEVAVAVAVAVVALVAPVLAVAVIYPSPLFVEEQPQYLRAGATSQHALMERVRLSVTMSTLLTLVVLFVLSHLCVSFFSAIFFLILFLKIHRRF
jgi:hypothetical protein